MGSGKTVVLSTSDLIEQHRPDWNGRGEVKYVHPRTSDKVVSKGKLETALKQDHQVLVVTTRPESEQGEWDNWWKALVPADRILSGDPDIEWGRKRLKDLWLRALGWMGIDVDPCETEDPLWYRNKLMSHPDVINGHNFEAVQLPQNMERVGTMVRQIRHNFERRHHG